MITAVSPAFTGAQRRRRLALALFRASAVTAVLVALYYLLPLDRLSDVPLGVSLTVGLAALTVVAAYQVRAVVRSPLPAIRAVEAVAATAPLFLLLFAAVYFQLAAADAGSFDVDSLSRTDALYFTVTVFATVGFGDITATSQAARVLVTVQMVLDLIVLGLGIRVFIGAVELGRRKNDPADAS
ncbi:potassium channel family protein [Jiangella muralis]|uniref:potassium channel family protein n=1 Tax=Jiangella muralis TaxID=702383 RepID=UPI00069D84A7|nr:potassium channel family protein [Jiangella muralis]